VILSFFEMSKTKKRVLDECTDIDGAQKESKCIDYARLRRMEICVSDENNDLDLKQTLLFHSLPDALKHKQKVCEEWADNPYDYDFHSTDFFNSLEFEDYIESLGNENQMSVIIKPIDLTLIDGNGSIMNLGDDCKRPR
jgi:hypothetical protein